MTIPEYARYGPDKSASCQDYRQTENCTAARPEPESSNLPNPLPHINQKRTGVLCPALIL